MTEKTNETEAKATQADANKTKPDAGGIKCSKCSCKHFRVVTTRKVPFGTRRYLRCRNCGHTMTTKETAEKK